MSEAKDFLGNPLEVGDTVVFCQLNSRSLKKGIVQKITPKTVSLSSEYRPYSIRQFHDQVVKINSTGGISDVQSIG